MLLYRNQTMYLFFFSLNILSFCIQIVCTTAYVEVNVYCFMPFYAMYIILMGLHLKFAHSAYGIGRRYRYLNNALKNVSSYGKITFSSIYTIHTHIFRVNLYSHFPVISYIFRFFQHIFYTSCYTFTDMCVSEYLGFYFFPFFFLISK